MVSVPTTRLPMPCARRPNSFEKERVQVWAVLGSMDKARYSRTWPVSGCKTAQALCVDEGCHWKAGCGGVSKILVRGVIEATKWACG